MSKQVSIVDDHLLLRMLLQDEPASLRPEGGVLVTTGLWYHRLCRSLSNTEVAGILSSRLGSADPSIGAAAVEDLTTLPEFIGLLSFRELAWPMARLVHDGARLNLLSLEALAAAEHYEAELCLSVADRNPTLIEAAQDRGIPVRSIAD